MRWAGGTLLRFRPAFGFLGAGCVRRIISCSANCSMRLFVSHKFRMPWHHLLPLGLQASSFKCQSRLSRLQNVVYFHKGDLYKAHAVHATSPPLSSM